MMIEAAGLFAVLLDPVCWVLFGVLGVLSVAAPPPRYYLFFAMCALAIVIAYVWPTAVKYAQFSLPLSGTTEEGFSPFQNKLFLQTKYFRNYDSYFVQVRSSKDMLKLMQAIDRHEQDCRTLVNAPEYRLGEACNDWVRWTHYLGGSIQFSIGAIAFAAWRRRRVPLERRGSLNPVHYFYLTAVKATAIMVRFRRRVAVWHKDFSEKVRREIDG